MSVTYHELNNTYKWQTVLENNEVSWKTLQDGENFAVIKFFPCT